MGYFEFWENIIRSSRDSNKDLAVFVLTYTLAPHAQYPTQLIQAVEGLRSLLTHSHRSPGQLLLGDDSAGGNLAIGVLFHLVHPHPSITKLDVQEPFGGGSLIAPWTSPNGPPPCDTDCRGDILTPHVTAPWSKAYMGNSKRDYYTDASTAPSDWFREIPVKKILILAGQNEILLPDIKKFVEKLEVRQSPAVIIF